MICGMAVHVSIIAESLFQRDKKVDARLEDKRNAFNYSSYDAVDDLRYCLNDCLR
jgi:hypothetical protein